MNNNGKKSIDPIDEILEQISPAELKKTRKKLLLASRIGDAMKTKGWTKSSFAREMGKLPSEISKWLSGTHNFTHDTLIDIEEKLGIELINYINKPKVIEYRLVVRSENVSQEEQRKFPKFNDFWSNQIQVKNSIDLPN